MFFLFFSHILFLSYYYLFLHSDLIFTIVPFFYFEFIFFHTLWVYFYIDNLLFSLHFFFCGLFFSCCVPGVDSWFCYDVFLCGSIYDRVLISDYLLFFYLWCDIDFLFTLCLFLMTCFLYMNSCYCYYSLMLQYLPYLCLRISCFVFFRIYMMVLFIIFIFVYICLFCIFGVSHHSVYYFLFVFCFVRRSSCAIFVSFWVSDSSLRIVSIFFIFQGCA